MRAILVLVATAGALQSAVPVEREPRHRLVFQNALVTVLDAELPAGGATAYHTHEHDGVAVAILPGQLTITALGAKPVPVTVVAGGVSFARGGYTHEGRNTGDTPIRFIDVEMRGPGPSERFDPEETVPHRTPIDNERVAVRRLVIPAGDSLPAHRHAGPLLEICVRGSTAPGTAGPASPGASLWREDGRVPPRKNAGTSEIEIVEVEWKP